MFNLSGSELVFLLLLALIVLGPEKLPEAVRKFGRVYSELKKMSTGFQTELKSALDEPMREMRETADALRKAAQFDVDLDPKAMFGLGGTTDATATPAAQDAATPAQGAAPAVEPAATTAETVETAETACDSEPAVPNPIERPPGPAFTSAAPPKLVVADNEPPLAPSTAPSPAEDGADTA